MVADDAELGANLGFLTVLDHPEHGLFGGYLLLNTAGRPIEFHCTAPIKPNRAQEILYGPTLEGFLYGELIGQALLREAKREPAFLCTDRQPVLAVREHVSLPVALVLPAEDDAAMDAEGTFRRIDAAHQAVPNAVEAIRDGSGLVTFQLGRNRLGVLQRCEADRQTILDRMAELAESFDLSEPFGRICEAIEEAQQAVR